MAGHVAFCLCLPAAAALRSLPDAWAACVRTGKSSTPGCGAVTHRINPAPSASLAALMRYPPVGDGLP